MLDQVVQYKNSSIIRLNSSKDDFQTVGKDRKKKFCQIWPEKASLVKEIGRP